MASNKDQAVKNLEQAQGKQTGPATDQGKDASSRNAIKHGGYSEKKIFGNCKGADCWFDKTKRCTLYASGKVKERELCLFKVESVKDLKLALVQDPIKAARDIETMHAALQDDTIRTAYAYITEDGLMVDEVVGCTEKGVPILRHKPHGALDYVRRATKDTAQLLKDLTHFDGGSDKPGFLMEDVLRALEQEEAMSTEGDAGQEEPIAQQ